MKPLILKMSIVQKVNSAYLIEISHQDEMTYVLFNPIVKELIFLVEDSLSALLKSNEHQLRTLLHNKRLETYYTGFELTFIIRPDKDVAGFNDRTKLVVLERRHDRYESYVLEASVEPIHKLFVDASYTARLGKGGIAVIHEDLDGDYHLYTEAVEGQGSNLMELLAAIKGLEILGDIDRVRIITDSQYVRKGLTEWLFNWRLNNWMTVNGEKVKNIDKWRRFDQLAEGKYIEFEWVKAHTNHFENTLCDLYAKAAYDK